MKNILLLTVFILGYYQSSVLAQQREHNPSIYFMPTVQFFNFENLNNVLTQNGFSRIGSAYAYGFGGYGTIQQWRIGGEGMYFTGESGNGATTTTLNGGLGYFYSGYAAALGNWQLVPAVGIGYGGVSVNATRSIDGSLQDLLTSQPNSSQVSNGNSYVHTSLALERTISNSYSIGLKAGYNMALSKNTWEAAGLNNSVSDSFGGWQLSLTFGFLLK